MSSNLTRSEPVDRAIERIDAKTLPFLERYGVTLLRVSLGVVFVWFGALKIFDVSPVSDLVGRMAYLLPRDTFVLVLGVVEVVVGVLLIVGRLLRFALALFCLQMLGTFLVLPILPGVAFRDGNPLLLTVEGEFVVKNLVLLSAGLVVGTTVKRRRAR
jgi:putative oxidoreductase